MIKTNKGMTEAHGSTNELMADISCIVESVYRKALLPDLSEKKAKELLQMAFDRAVAEKEADKPEVDEEKVERVEKLLHELVSKILEAMEGEEA